MPTKCGVCGEKDSKYKCPVAACRLPYCSLDCYRPHKELHATGDNCQIHGDGPSVPKEAQNSSSRVDTRNGASSDSSSRLQDLQKLFEKQPKLRSHLLEVYRTSQDGPAADGRRRDHRLQNYSQSIEMKQAYKDKAAIDALSAMLHSGDGEKQAALTDFLEFVRVSTSESE